MTSCVCQPELELQKLDIIAQLKNIKSEYSDLLK